MRLLRTSDDLYRSFIADAEEDLSSPTTSVFSHQISRYRQAVQELNEGADNDLEALGKFRKCIKSMLVSQEDTLHTEECLAESLCNLAALSNPGACRGDSDTEISTAWLKFSVLFKELAHVTKIFVRNSQNCVAVPLSSLVKSDNRNKVSLKQAEKAFREYQGKFSRLEKDVRNQSGADVYKLSQVDLAEALLRERTILQFELCQLFLKSSKIQSKSSVGLVQAMVELYHAMSNYFRKSLQVMEEAKSYVDGLEASLNDIKVKQTQEQRAMQTLCKSLKKSAALVDYDAAKTDDSQGSLDSWSVTVPEPCAADGTPSTSHLKSGYLLKRSKRRMNRNWYKRRCEVRGGFFYIWHDNESLSPIQINLLACQVVPSRDDPRLFVVHSHDRKYEFQADTDAIAAEWVSVLNVMRKLAEKEAMSDEAVSGEHIQKLAVSRIKSLPGNDVCCDCGSPKDVTWLCTNFGSLHCIDCAGAHRELGVHVSRIQSLTLDRLDRATALIPLALGNQKVNMVLEASYSGAKHMNTVLDRKRFIQAKYVQRTFVSPVTDRPMEYLVETITLGSVSNLLHLFASGIDLNTTVDPSTGDTALLMAIAADVGGSHMAFIQFLLQNGADSNATNAAHETAVHVCVRQNKPECLKLLLMTWNIDLEVKNEAGLTALQLARRLQREPCERLILKFDENNKFTFADVEVPLSLLNSTLEESTEGSEVPVRRYGTFKARSLPLSHGVRSATEGMLREPRVGSVRGSAVFDGHLFTAASPTGCKSFTLARMENNGQETALRRNSCTDERPQPAPRKAKTGAPLLRKCRALYNCEADNLDEISFKKGDEIVVTKEILSDENDCWMEGYVLGKPQKSGRFPTSFVTFEKE